jgi:hypothetical protein
MTKNGAGSFHFPRRLKTGSEKIVCRLCRFSILLGFIMSKKQERLHSELLSEDKITNLLGFFYIIKTSVSTGRDVPLSLCPGTKNFFCPGVPLSRDKITFPKEHKKQEKDVPKQEKDIL